MGERIKVRAKRLSCTPQLQWRESERESHISGDRSCGPAILIAGSCAIDGLWVSEILSYMLIRLSWRVRSAGAVDAGTSPLHSASLQSCNYAGAENRTAAYNAGRAAVTFSPFLPLALFVW